jgi:hypothetical protein
MKLRPIRALSNFEIEEYCMKKGLPLKGVMSKDLLDNTALKNGDVYVLNLDTTDGNGTHWVCLMKNKGISLYYDPFGVEPPESVLAKIKNTKGRCYYSQEVNQDLDSVLCGYYCLSIIKSIFRDNISFRDYLAKLYNEPNKKNKKFIMNNLK